MRLMTFIAIAVSLNFIVEAANADLYAWCAVYGGSGGTSCSFVTLEQCQATVSGLGGFCQSNPLYTRQAPVGHRQPMAKDLPADVLQNEQRATPGNKTPKICKGC
jgi:uncharacterized protein DUF3551